MKTDSRPTRLPRRFRAPQIMAIALLTLFAFISQPVADAGTIYVSQDTTPGPIFAFSSTGAETLYTTASSFITSMAADSAGDLYFAPFSSDTIVKTAPGGVQTTFATGFSSSISGMACDAGGDLFVLQGSSIIKYSPGGVPTLFATDNDGPIRIGVAGNGSVFVLDQGPPSESRIEKFTPSGVGSVFASNIHTPRAFAVDTNGNVYVAADNDQLGAEIFKFLPDGTQTHFAYPPIWALGFAVDPTTNQLYGSFDPNANFVEPNELVYKFDQNGNATEVAQVPYAAVLTAATPEPTSLVLALIAAVGGWLFLIKSGRFRFSPGNAHWSS